MSDARDPKRTLPLSALERHDRICDRLEAGWQTGRPPLIEDLLKEVPEGEAAVLFVALLRVELERRTDSPDAGQYSARFPAFADLVESVFRDPAATGAWLPPDAEPPAIAGYELAGQLGRGGMGVVFRARQLDLNRPVAIKMIRAGVCSRPDQLVRFQLEARSVARLAHPNVVLVHAYGHVEGRPYLVMELVEGGSLADKLAGAPADPTWAAGVVEQLAAAVQYIHDRKIVHRDLKPANVLLTADGTPKVTDFGLAKALAADDPGVTQSYAVLGTACYMSPEQAGGDSKAVGPAADVYALGGILYECLTGRPPFRAETYAKTVALVLSDDPARPSDLVPGLPPDLEAVCLKCLDKDPARRYAAGELAADLARFRQNLPVHARPLSAADRHARWAAKVGFELGESLHADEAAATYLARRTPVKQRVQLKLSAGLLGSPAHAALRREADAMGDLDSPYVVRMLEYGEQFGQPYLVTEHLDGAQPLGRLAPLAARPAAELALMLALGVHAVHECGVRHGGLRTDAVLVTRDHVPKIGGFAAARPAGAADLADDLPALGGLFAELLTGAPAAALPPTVDHPFAGIVRKCLDPDPRRRYPSAGALALDLQLYLSPAGAVDSSDATVMTKVVPPVDRAARYRLRVTDGPDRVGATFELSRTRTMVGRSSSSNVVLDGRKVSRVHCAVVWNDDEACHELVELGAANVTSVNGRVVKESKRRLADGDRVTVANYTLAFERLPDGPA